MTHEQKPESAKFPEADPRDCLLEFVPNPVGRRIVVGGVPVPNLVGLETHNGTRAEFILDDRFSLTVPTEYSEAVAWFVAQAMAVAAGYTAFGVDSKPANPFSRRMVCIGEINGSDVGEAP